MFDKLHPILRSRRFFSALTGIIAMLIVPILPEAWNVSEAQVTEYIVYIVVALVSAYGAQDFAKAWKGNE